LREAGRLGHPARRGGGIAKGRLEAFSDGVLAIIITIMVLELAVPYDASPAALLPVIPTLLSYLLSFIFLGIYWNNHHHLSRAEVGLHFLSGVWSVNREKRPRSTWGRAHSVPRRSRQSVSISRLGRAMSSQA
jgi:hypothetical protein